MSEQIKDGGPAFPCGPDKLAEMIALQSGKPLAKNSTSAMGSCGMSLRDYFAAKAMQGVIAQACGTAFGSDPKYAADYAYAAADAMLAAREAKS